MRTFDYVTVVLLIALGCVCGALHQENVKLKNFVEMVSNELYDVGVKTDANEKAIWNAKLKMEVISQTAADAYVKASETDYSPSYRN